MSRSTGLSSFAANFEPKVASPLDGRTVVSYLSDLSASATWNTGDGNAYVYVGLPVAVTNDGGNNGIYWLKSSDYSSLSNWEKIGSGFVTTEELVAVSGSLYSLIANTSGGSISGGTTNHALLSNLDYGNSGHIGFASESSLIAMSGNLYSIIQNTSGYLQSEIDTINSTISVLAGISAVPQLSPSIFDIPGILIPTYIYPASAYTNPDYNNLIDLKKKYHEVPLVTILNDSSGHITVEDGNYTAAIKRLNGAGAITIGYVATNYALSGAAQVRSLIDGWINYYPDIQGIFFDEMDNNISAAPYYKSLTDYAKQKGLKLTIGNPGSAVTADYLDTNCVDNITIYESAGYPSESYLKGDFSGGYSDVHYHSRSAIAYNVSYDYDSLTVMKKYCGLIYATDDNLPNPWNTFPSYLENIFKVLSINDSIQTQINNNYSTIVSSSGNLYSLIQSTSGNLYSLIQSTSASNYSELVSVSGNLYSLIQSTSASNHSELVSISGNLYSLIQSTSGYLQSEIIALSAADVTLSTSISGLSNHFVHAEITGVSGSWSQVSCVPIAATNKVVWELVAIDEDDVSHRYASTISAIHDGATGVAWSEYAILHTGTETNLQVRVTNDGTTLCLEVSE